jgi:hypothetical protein
MVMTSSSINSSVNIDLGSHNISSIAGLYGVGSNPIVCSPLNLSYNDISYVSQLQFQSNGSSPTANFENNVSQNGGFYFVLSMNQGYSIAINGTERTRYDGTYCQFFDPVILPTGSTAVTQPVGTNNTTLATTAFVQSVVPTLRVFTFVETTTSSVLQPSPISTETIQQGNSVQFTNTIFSITIFAFNIYACVLEFDDLPFATPPPSIYGSAQVINGVLQSTLTSYQFYCLWSSSAPWTLSLVPSTGTPTYNGAVYAFNLQSLGIFPA